MVACDLAKVRARVRFSLPAPFNADVLLGEDLAFQANEVGSNPSIRSNF